MRGDIAILLLTVLFQNFEFAQSEDLFCDTYNYLTCSGKNKTECVTEEKCPVTSEARSHCITYWEYDIKTKTAKVQIMGCFLSRNNPDCYNKKSHCIQKIRKGLTSELYFCCCNGNLCSKNFTNSYLLEQRVKLHKTDVEVKDDTTWNIQYLSFFMLMCALLIIIVISIAACVFPRRKSVNLKEEQTSLEAGERMPQDAIKIEFKISMEDEMDTSSLSANLLEKLAEGRFGSVWRARRGDEDLAVKIFPLRYQESWKSELEVFRLPFMEHDSLLQYVASGRQGSNLDAELWLVTPYHELGSLSDYLIENILTYEQMFSVAISMTSGLKHLHQEVGQPSSCLPDGYKPSVAHRDFKSRNVLLSVSAAGELRACVADFGLALTFRPGSLRNLRHGRVGTVRYMAPEVLQGAISFNRASFLAIDMYACGLVLWEIASRCRVNENSLVEEYGLPFEKEVGLQPNLEEMQHCVVEEQKRPQILESWRKHYGLAFICETIEECWDKDADARLSSSCVFDRLSSWKEKSNSV